MREPAADPNQVEMEVWQCLDSVHHLLKRREILHQTLRQGWMELTSARYAMGPARISSPLFSLKPHTPSSVVDVRGSYRDVSGEDSVSEVEEDCEQVLNSSPVAFDLVRNRVEKELKASLSKSDDLTVGKKRSPAQLRHRFSSNTHSDDEKQERWQLRGLTDDSASESDDESSLAETARSDVLRAQSSSSAPDQQASKDTTQPLYWFGALVSPHLRAAQNSFSQALDLIVELANAQNEATNAHSNVLRLRSAISEVEN